MDGVKGVAKCRTSPSAVPVRGRRGDTLVRREEVWREEGEGRILIYSEFKAVKVNEYMNIYSRYHRIFVYNLF